ncbi:hypothetical protein CEP53_010017 [Fusarium sp. AF-6]|nr:hypothetical protein CEP53_010017 [Fusarium sp. AF-6]
MRTLRIALQFSPNKPRNDFPWRNTFQENGSEISDVVCKRRLTPGRYRQTVRIPEEGAEVVFEAVLRISHMLVK